LDAWSAYAEEIEEQIASRTDFDSQDLGPQLLAVKSGARGMLRHLARLCGPRGIVPDVTGKSVVVRHGLSFGYTPAEAFACAVPAREGLAQVAIDTTRAAYGISQPRLSGGFNVLARAMRATRPGIVFARAAATSEIDPLTDLDSRLFVGLPPQGNLAGRVG
jgi:hypothetical protein